MEDLFTLERQEALRREEYEFLHSLALLRVEREASMRLSLDTPGPLFVNDGEPGTKPSTTDLPLPKNSDLGASTSRLRRWQFCMPCR